MSKKTTLLLIDVQNIMFSYEGGSLWNEQQVLKNITSLREKAYKSNVPIIYIQHTDSSSDSMLSEVFKTLHPKKYLHIQKEAFARYQQRLLFY